jgi:hypothetical protein
MEFATISYSPKPCDYSTTIRINKLRTHSYLTPLLLFLILFTGLDIILNVITQNDIPLLRGLSIVFIFSLTILFYLYYFSSLKIERNVRRTDFFTTFTTLTLFQEYLILKNDYVEFKYQWKDFKKTVEIRDYFLLISSLDNNCCVFIPKRSIVGKETLESFRFFLKNVIPGFEDNSHSLTNNEPYLSSTVIPLIIYFVIILSIFLIAFVISH